MTGHVETASVPSLDLRGLDPPEPMRRALEAIEALGPGKVLEVITDREPLLLHRELARRGYSYLGDARSHGFCTTVRPRRGGDAS